LASKFPKHVVDIEHRLRHVATVVRRKGRVLLEDYGITPPQFDALVILDLEGDLTIGDLSNRLFLAYSTTTDLVDRLERAEFVVRQRDLHDRRVVRVTVQAHGSLLIEQVLEARRAYLSTVLDSINSQELCDIQRILDLLDKGMRDV